MKVFAFLFLFFTGGLAHGQINDSLSQLKDVSFPSYFSKAYKERASSITSVLEKAFQWHTKNLGFKPSISLLVLDTTDWKTYSSKGAPYGMPHYNNEKKQLIVAAHDNAMWKSFLPPADQLPADLRQPMIATYTNKEGALSSQPFFDLLAIHELGHAFTSQAGIHMQRQWMSELYSNIFLHTYIAEKEPGLLPALTLFPKMVAGGSAKGFKYTSLKDLQENYNDVATKNPRNYGWYQCRWHVAAGEIYDAGGKQTAKKLWDAFAGEKNKLSDEALLTWLDNTGNKPVADMVRNWDAHTIQ